MEELDSDVVIISITKTSIMFFFSIHILRKVNQETYEILEVDEHVVLYQLFFYNFIRTFLWNSSKDPHWLP